MANFGILGWILILLVVGAIFAAIGFDSAATVAFGGAQFLVGLVVFLFILGIIGFSLLKKG